MSVPGMLLLAVISAVLVGAIAWLLPRPDGSLALRERSDRQPPG